MTAETTQIPPEDRREGIKLQLEAFLSEYRVLRDQIASARELQGHLDNISLIGLGISITLILAVLERDPRSAGVILLFPVLFYAIVFTQMRQERIVVISAIYIDRELRPKVNNLLAQLSGAEVSVFEFEKFLYSRSKSPLWLNWMATASRSVLSLAIGTGIIALYLYLRLSIPLTGWEPYVVILLLVDTLFLAANLMRAYTLTRTKSGYLQTSYH